MNTIIMNKLKSFNIHNEFDNLHEITIIDLLIEENCIGFLSKQMKEIKAPNLAVAASMLSKRYAYLVVSSTLYSMVEFNCALSLPIEACALSRERKLYINSEMCNWQELLGLDREKWRENVLRNLFSNHITPVLNSLEKTSRIPPVILWENVAVRINSIYRKISSNQMDPTKIELVESDFYFLKAANGELFNLENNPIKDYLKLKDDLTENPSRKTCCMYYKLEEDLEGIGYCGNCPIRNKKKRKIIK